MLKNDIKLKSLLDKTVVSMYLVRDRVNKGIASYKNFIDAMDRLVVEALYIFDNYDEDVSDHEITLISEKLCELASLADEADLKQDDRDSIDDYMISVIYKLRVQYKYNFDLQEV